MLLDLNYNHLKYRPAGPTESGIAVALYVEELKRQNNGMDPELAGRRGKQGWIVPRLFSGTSIVVVGPDERLSSFTPSVCGHTGKHIMWAITLGSSYSGAYIDRGDPERITKDLLMIKLHGYG